MRLSDAIARFMEIKSPNWSSLTVDNYEGTFRVLRSIFNRDIKVSTITYIDINSLIYDDKYYARPPVRPRTRGKRYDHLMYFFRWCIEIGIIKQNPIRRIVKPHIDNQIRDIPTAGEMAEFLNYCHPPFNVLCLLMAHIGPRSGELFRNKKSTWQPARMNFEKNCIIFRGTKTHRDREVPVPDISIEYFTGHFARYEGCKTMIDFLRLYAMPDGSLDFGITTNEIWQVVKSAWHAMGKDFCVQTLRTFCATHLVSIFGGTFLPSKILGNTEKTMNKSYAHPLWDDIVEGINRLKIMPEERDENQGE